MVLKPGREDVARARLREMGARFRGDRPDDRHRAAGPAHARRDRRRHRRSGRSRRGAGLRPALGSATPRQPDIDAGDRLAPARPDRGARRRLIGLPGPRQQALDLGAVRPHGHGRHRAAAGRRRRGRARPWHAARPWRMTTDCTPRYCLADPVRGRPPGGGRGLAQPDRGRRAAAGDHRQPQFRQSGEARDHGPVRRLPRRAWREACPALDFPVVSGNVSLYNETKRRRDPRPPR